MDDRIAVEVSDGVAQVRLTRGDKLNALDPAMFDAILATIDRLDGMRELRAVVLHGEGRAFCAGLDLASMASVGSGVDLDARTHGLANRFQQVAWGWRSLPVPVIAALHGVAFGGGLQIASGADVRFAAPGTRLAVMELKWGIVPDMAGFALWRGTVRDDCLRELVYTAREFDAAEGQALGFVTRIAEDPHAKALALARVIAERNPGAIRGAKRLANAMADNDAAAILAAESAEQGKVMRTPNQMEAVRAAMEKRAPVFRDAE